MAIRVMMIGLRQLFLILSMVAIMGFADLANPVHRQLQPGLRGLASDSSDSDFLSVCKAFSSVKNFKPTVCDDIHKKYFSKVAKEKAYAEFLPSDVGAPKQELDPKIRFMVFQDANAVSALSYCYFVFRGWIHSDQLTPDDLGMASTGFSITSEDAAAYQNWIETSEKGKSCKTLVEGQTGYAQANLQKELGDKVAIVAINPLAVVLSGANTAPLASAEFRVTLNHERIHAYQSKCPMLEAWGQKQWLSLSKEDQKVIRDKLSAYNWNDIRVAGREYSAYLFENDPKGIASLIKGCEL